VPYRVAVQYRACTVFSVKRERELGEGNSGRCDCLKILEKYALGRAIFGERDPGCPLTPDPCVFG